MSKQILFAALGTAMALAACSDIPDFRRGERLSAPFIPYASAPMAPAQPLAPAGPSADVAERACTDAGAAAGFEVQGVVGTRDVTDTAGISVSRDVVLRVQRGGQSLEVRCSYAYATANARIMTL